MSQLQELLKSLSTKTIKHIIRTHNLHTVIRLGQKRDELIKGVITHYDLHNAKEIRSKLFILQLPEEEVKKILEKPPKRKVNIKRKPVEPVKAVEPVEPVIEEQKPNKDEEAEKAEKKKKDREAFLIRIRGQHAEIKRKKDEEAEKVEKSKRTLTGINMLNDIKQRKKLSDDAKKDLDIRREAKKKRDEDEAEKKRDEEEAEKKRKKTSLTITITAPKKGDEYFNPNFSKLSKIEQLETALKTASIKGTQPNKEFYENIADDFYKNINSILNKSPYVAIKDLVNKYQFTPKMLKDMYEAKSSSDFFPTGFDMVKQIFNGRFKRDEWTMLEGTAGIGNVGYWAQHINPKLKITMNELNKNNFDIMKLFTDRDKMNLLNEDYFKIDNDRGKYDLIFLNPPFGSDANKNPSIWFKFLLKSLQLLQDINYATILFISPRLYGVKNERENEQFFSILDLIKNKNNTDGYIPTSRWLKIFNEFTHENFKEKDIKEALDTNEGALQEYINDNFAFYTATTEKLKSDDFGGTKLTAYFTEFQVNVSSSSKSSKGRGFKKPVNVSRKNTKEKYALSDIIKFNKLKNEKEQSDFIKNGDEHFINLLKMITNRLLKTGTKQKLLKPITKGHLKAIKKSVDKNDTIKHIIDVNTLHGGGLFDMFKGFGSSLSSGLGKLGSSLGSIGSSVMKSVGGLGSSLGSMFSKGVSGVGSMFSKGLGSLSSGVGKLGTSLLDGAKKHGPGLVKSGLKQGLNIGMNFVPGGATINSLISPHVNKWIDKGVDGVVNYFSKPSTGGALKISTLKTLIDNSYQRKDEKGKIKPKQENIDGYQLDKDLTTDTSAVYYHKGNNRVAHSIRGTNGTAEDWDNNLVYMVSPKNYLKTERYKNAKDVQDKINEKYKDAKKTITTHSQSGIIGRYLALENPDAEVISLNPASSWQDNKIQPKNVSTIKSTTDAVSLFHKKTPRDIIIPGESLNQYKEHDIGLLDRLDKDRMIGTN